MHGILRTVHGVEKQGRAKGATDIGRLQKRECGEMMGKNKQKLLSWHATIVAFQRCLEVCCTKIGIQVNFKLSTQDAVNAATPPEN